MPADSVITATDTLTALPDTTVTAPMPWAPRVSHESDAPVATGAERGTTLVAYTRGLEPQPRNLLPGYDSGVMAVVIGTFLLLSLNFRHYSTFLKTFTQDLWDTRRRLNSNTDHTVSETRITMSLITLACVCEGILVFSALSAAGFTAGTTVLGGLLTAIGVSAGFYIFGLTAYTTVGYAFTTAEATAHWLRGFNASQSLLGLALVVPALIALFNPGAAVAMAWVGASLYVVARIIFIYKGFRLFYENLFSLVYFILYLCTLEIAPFLFIIKGALSST